ncbi:UNVERIFIED_CONTAM: hypothetical protein GTU68_042411 [Idotea baltica]|nr:hypothetical protein [Idotea baltica]
MSTRCRPPSCCALT